MKGKLIVFEGIDNCGKDTCILGLKHAFSRSYKDILIVPSVTTTAIGKEIRLLTKYKNNISFNPDQLIPLYIADFYNKLEIVKDGLDQGYVVLCNRWYTSILAYSHRDESLDAIKTLIVTDIIPDKLYYLNIDVDKAICRIPRSNKQHDVYTNKSYLTRAKSIYDKVLDKNLNTVEINANLTKVTMLYHITQDLLNDDKDYGLLESKCNFKV